MSAFTEKNFDACLEAISAIRSQRDEAVRLADALALLLVAADHEFKGGCQCMKCDAQRELTNLKVHILTYHSKIQRKK